MNKKAKRYKMGHKMQRKTWEDYDKDQEDRKIKWFFIALFVFSIIMVLFMWFVKQTMSK